MFGGIALGCSLVLASTSSAQTRVLTTQVDGTAITGNALEPNPLTVPRHAGNGPFDMNNLPQDVLDCEVCRQRLGLPPLKSLASSMASQPRAASQQIAPQQLVPPHARPIQPGTVRMLGSPGMMSSMVAEQMAKQGYVVEEFKPPQPAHDALQLGNIPPEARQQFMQSLNLPLGARIMSAEVKGQQNSGVPAVNNVDLELGRGTSPSDKTLGAPEIGLQPEVISSKSESLELNTAPPAPKSEPESKPELMPTPIPTQTASPQLDAPAKEQQIRLEQTVVELQKKLELEATEHAKLNAMLERTQTESQKRIESADAANREVLKMLEKRTAEVTELQLKLKSQQEAMEKMEAKSKESDEKRHELNKAEPQKKEQRKGKSKKTEKPKSNT